jgi:hypothetical protein
LRPNFRLEMGFSEQEQLATSAGWEEGVGYGTHNIQHNIHMIYIICNIIYKE